MNVNVCVTSRSGDTAGGVACSDLTCRSGKFICDNKRLNQEVSVPARELSNFYTLNF